MLKKLTPKQRLNIKDPVMNMNNKLNRIFPLFNPFSSEFSSRDRLIGIFPSCFSFYFTDRKNEESKKVYICKLNELVL